MGNPFSTWLSSVEEESASASASEDTFPDIVKERYHIVRKIGKGAFGSVYEVRDKRSNAKFAMKKLAHSNKGNEVRHLRIHNVMLITSLTIANFEGSSSSWLRRRVCCEAL